MTRITSYRVDYFTNPLRSINGSYYATLLEAQQEFAYRCDRQYECELVAIDEYGRTHLMDENRPAATK